MATNYIPKIVYGTGPTTIQFDYPPKGDVKNQTLKATGRTTVSKSGAQQTVTDFVEEINKLTYSHVSETLKTSLETFFLTHALLGKSFTYFFDSGDVATSFTVQLDPTSFKIDFDIMTRKGTGFVYKFTMAFRRVR